MNHMLRPKATVLPKSAQIPEQNLIRPPPNQFSHEVVADQAYYFIDPQQTAQSEGKFLAGTHVLLLAYDGGPACRVADAQGLYVATAFDGLRPLRAQAIRRRPLRE